MTAKKKAAPRKRAAKQAAEPAAKQAKAGPAAPPDPPPAVPGSEPVTTGTIADVADALKATLTTPEPEPPKRKRGRPRKADVQAEQRQAAETAKAARVGVMSVALTATIGSMVTHFEMSPPFGKASGDALAEAWDPVLVEYMKESGPMAQAIAVTVVVMMPYLMQGAAKLRNRAVNRNAQSQHLVGRPAGRGQDSTSDPVS